MVKDGLLQIRRKQNLVKHDTLRIIDGDMKGARGEVIEVRKNFIKVKVQNTQLV